MKMVEIEDIQWCRYYVDAVGLKSGGADIGVGSRSLGIKVEPRIGTRKVTHTSFFCKDVSVLLPTLLRQRGFVVLVEWAGAVWRVICCCLGCFLRRRQRGSCSISD